MNKSIAIGLIIALLSGCVSKPQLQTIPQGSLMEISVQNPSEVIKNVEVINKSLLSNTLTGTASGSVIGAAAGLPILFLVPGLGALAGVVFIAMGPIIGAGTGAVVGMTGALSSDKAKQLTERFVQLENARPLDIKLREKLTASAKKSWQVGNHPTASVLTVEILDFRLVSMRDESVQLSITVGASLRKDKLDKNKITHQKTYDYTSTTTPLPIWLDESSEFADITLSNAMEHISMQIISDLNSKQ